MKKTIEEIREEKYKLEAELSEKFPKEALLYFIEETGISMDNIRLELVCNDACSLDDIPPKYIFAGVKVILPPITI